MVGRRRQPLASNIRLQRHVGFRARWGAAGSYYSDNAIFVTAALLCIPALLALGFIQKDEIDYRRARNAASGKGTGETARVFDLAKNHRLMLFAAALVLFQLACVDATAGEHLATKSLADSSLWMAGLIIVPQIVVASLAPWVGYHSERQGRRPLLLISFCLEPIRAALFALTSNYWFLLAAQLLDGITGAIIGVLTVVVITDLTTETGRFNLARGTIGALTGIAASLSTDRLCGSGTRCSERVHFDRNSFVQRDDSLVAVPIRNKAWAVFGLTDRPEPR
jgi:hypothetical protein